MSERDVHSDDMFDDDPVLAAFARDLERAGASTPPPVVGAALASVLEGTTPVATYPEVTVPADRPARRRRAGTRLRWAVGSAVFGLGFGSLGIAGALPGPVQRQVARMANTVGIELPDGSSDDERETPPVPTTTSTTVPPTTSTTTPATTTTTVATTVVVLDPDDDTPASTVADDDSGPGSNGNGNANGHDDKPGRDDDKPGRDDEGDDDQGDDDEGDDSSGPGSGHDEREDRDEESRGPDEPEDDHRGPGGGDDDDDSGTTP